MSLATEFIDYQYGPETREKEMKRPSEKLIRVVEDRDPQFPNSLEYVL
jgi:hypothetical protein